MGLIERIFMHFIFKSYQISTVISDLKNIQKYIELLNLTEFQLPSSFFSIHNK
jgi:hypothetical protein